MIAIDLISRQSQTHLPAAVGFQKSGMEWDHLLDRASVSVPHCVAVACFDMASGRLLTPPASVADPGGQPDEGIFNPAYMAMVAQLWRLAVNFLKDGADSRQEVILSGGELTHLLLRSRSEPDHVAAFVCRKGANIGIALAKARLAQSEIEHATNQLSARKRGAWLGERSGCLQ